MHRDTVIGIVGVVILVAAMVGVFTYERGQASSLAGDGGGATENVTGPSETGTVALGATEDVVLSMNETGITNVTFTLTWTPGAGVDTLVLRVAPSNATGITDGFESDPENDGEITIVVPVNNTAADGQLGVGDWQVSVEFVSASPTTPVGPPPVSPPVAPPGTTDTQVGFEVSTSIEAYASA
jgi:hypothetical protein